MGFTNLLLAEIAADYSVPLEKVLSLCDKPAVEAWKTGRLAISIFEIEYRCQVLC